MEVCGRRRLFSWRNTIQRLKRTCNLLQSSAGNHSHSRGTIGNDLTGMIDGDCIGGDPAWGYTANGVFSITGGTEEQATGSGHGPNMRIRFSGSSG